MSRTQNSATMTISRRMDFLPRKCAFPLPAVLLALFASIPLAQCLVAVRSTTSFVPSPPYAVASLSRRRRRHNQHALFMAEPATTATTTTATNTEPNANNAVEDEDDDDAYNEPFTLLSSLAAITLLQSDRRRDAIGKDVGAQASSATNWVDEGSAFRMRGALNKLKLWLPGDNGSTNNNNVNNNYRSRDRQDEAIAWLRWIRSIPKPMVVDLSNEARAAANATVSDDFLALLNLNGDTAAAGTTTTSTKQQNDQQPQQSPQSTTSSTNKTKKMQQIRTQFLNRLSCKLILLPSGQPLQGGLVEPTGALVFGKLLYGGVTRYRVLPSSSSSGRNNNNASAPGSSSPRRAGERTERKSTASEQIPSWTQYGGTERRYDAVDMGPAMVIEFTLLPKIQAGSESARDNNDDDYATATTAASTANQQSLRDMTLRRLAWNPQHMFDFVSEDDGDSKGGANAASNGNGRDNNASFGPGASMTLQGKERNDAFSSDFRSRVGGLGPQIDSIVRRVLDGRVIRPAEVDGRGNLLSFDEAKSQYGGDDNDSLNGNNEQNQAMGLEDASKQLSLAAMEAEELALLGLTPVRGLLLYGPPGCGKTALAREIARALRARAPKIVAAPELLDRWVGGSERLVRELFNDAEAELAACNGDPTRSALHVIVIDEIDAVFRKRSSAEDSGEATRSSTVNQILSKLDGVEAIPNVLLIGMTNRRELLDEALLRPGRLEVQIEIPLPNRIGRREILQIHFSALRSRGRLSNPLLCALDGVPSTYNGETIEEPRDPDLNGGRKRRAIKRATNNIFGYLSSGGKPVYDLADVTDGFSGADLEGLVRCAGSIALSRARKEGAGVEALLITLDDVKQALLEVKV